MEITKSFIELTAMNVIIYTLAIKKLLPDFKDKKQTLNTDN